MALTLTTEGMTAPAITPPIVPELAIDPNDVFGMEPPDFRTDYEKSMEPYEKEMDTWRQNFSGMLEKDILDPQSYASEEVPYGFKPDEWRKRRIVDDWMRLHTDGQDPPMGLHREFERGRLAQQAFGGAGADSDESLFAEITGKAQGRKDARDLTQNLRSEAYSSAVIGGAGEKSATFAEWKEQASKLPGYDATYEGTYYLQYQNARQEAKERLEPVKGPLKEVWDAMKQGGAGSPSEIVKELLPFASVIGDDLVDEIKKKDAGALAFEHYNKLDEQGRAAFMDGLHTIIQQFPKEQRPALLATWGKSFGSVIDDMGRGAMSRFTMKGLEEHLNRGVAGSAGPWGASDADKAEATKRADALHADNLAQQNFMKEVRRMERDEYAPTQFYSDPSDDVFSLRTLEGGFYGSASAAASVAVMATPIIGYPTLALAMEDFAYNDLRANAMRSGSSEADATKFADEHKTIAAVPQLAAEIIQNKLALGKIPAIRNVLTKIGDKITNRAVRGTVSALTFTTAESVVEEVQYLTPYVVQDLAAAFEADTGIPAAEWSNGKNGALDGFWTRQATTFISMLPMGIGGAAGGLHTEARNESFRQASPLELQSYGFQDEDIANIQNAPGPSSLAAGIDNAWEGRDPNSPEALAAVEKLKTRVEQTRRASTLLEEIGYSMPAITAMPDGSFIVRDNLTGEEVGRATTTAELDSVVRGHTVAMESMQEDEMRQLTAWLAAGHVAAKKSGIAQELNLSRRFGMQDVEEMGPAAVERFMAEVALQEQAEGGDGSATRAVFGYNLTETRDGVKQMTNRIFQGANIGTLFHENWHGARKQAKAAGNLTREDDIRFLRAFDAVLKGRQTREVKAEDGSTLAPATRESFLPDGMADADISETHLDEAIAEVAEVLTFLFPRNHTTNKHGLTRKLVSTYLGTVGRLAPEATRKFSGFIRAIRAKMGLAMSRAYHVKKAIAKGELDPAEIDSYMGKLFGTDEQAEHDDGVRTELGRILNMEEDVDPDNIPFSIGRQVDAEYLELAKDPEANQDRLAELVQAEMLRKGYSKDDSYKMMHRAPGRPESSEDGESGVVSLANLKNSSLVPEDYWTRPDWYISTATERESHAKIMKAMNGARIRVYRTVPATAKDSKIKNGDWVTPSRQYAIESGHDENAPVKILEMTVRADQLFWDGNSVDELGFDDGNDYAYKNTKNNRKLTDLVTFDYDEAGNESIIPLSKRFNYRDSSPRFSIGRVAERPLYSATNVQDLRHDKTVWLESDASPAGADEIVSKFYKTAAFAGVPRDAVLVAMPSTSGRNTLPLALARRIAKDFGQVIEGRPVGFATAKGEAKNKRTFFDKESDPVGFEPNSAVIADLQGKPVFITEDVHNTGESWIAFARMLQENNVDVRGVATLVSTEQRITSPRDMERMSQKIAALLGKDIDEVKAAVHSLFDGTFKQLFNKAEAEISRANERSNASNAGKLFDIASSGRRAGAYSNPFRSGDEGGGSLLGGNGQEQSTFQFSIGRTSVSATAATRTFQGTTGETVIGPAAFAIGAWHGTPHQVDKFSTDKIGTGEGAQAYGWGLYFADSKSVSETYMENTESRAKVQYTEVLRYDGERVDALDWPSVKKRAASAIRSMGKARAIQTATDRSANELLTAIESLDESKISSGLERFGAPTGNLYRVTLKVEDEDLLDWDKPLSEQSEKVKAAVGRAYSEQGLDDPNESATPKEGQYIYKDMVAAAGGLQTLDVAKASEYLASIGIRGIRYKDGNSRVSPLQIQAAKKSVESWRGKDADQLRYAERDLAELLKKDAEGSYNYVVFDEADIEILEENGTPVDKSAPRFSIGRAEVAERMQGGALSLVRDPIRRVQAMSRVARDFGDLSLSFQRIEALAGRRMSKGQLRQEANAREDMAADEKIGAVWARYGSLLADDDLTRIKSQPVHAYLSVKRADGKPDPLHGRIMSKVQAMKRYPERYALHRGGEYDGSDNISRSIYGGQLMPDQAAQELFDAGLISEPYTDAMWEALAREQNSVIKNKEALAKALEEIREAKREAKREASEWLATQGKEQETNYNPKQEILASLRMLDAILLALPPEIRGKIGGYTQMAMIATDEARLAFLKDKLKKADKELETFLRESFNTEWLDLLKRAKPDKDNPGQRPIGQIDADALDILRAAESAMWLDFSKGEAEADRLDALAEHEDTKPEDADKLRTTAQMVRLTTNWSTGDAARREQAVIEGTRIYYGGLMALRVKNSARAERLRGLQTSAKQGTGQAGDRMDRKKMQRKEKAGRAGQAGRLVWEFLSFGQLTNVLFGESSAVAKWFNAKEIAASNAYEDGVQAKAEAIESMFESLSGSRFNGEKLRHRMQTKEAIQTTDAHGNEHTFTEAEGISFLLMWRQEDGKRHMEGQIDDEGNLVSEWGWTDQAANDIESQLTPEAKSMMAFLGTSYGEEYGRINDVFRRIWNVSMPRHKFYAPLTVKPSMGKQDAIVDPVSGDSMGVGMTPGSLKNRSQTAVTEPDFRDAFQVFLTHARQMEHFVSYAEFARDAMAVVNRREIRNSIEAVSPTAATALGKWVDYFALGGLREAAAGGAWQQFFAGALSRLSSAALVGRVSVLGMQTLQLGAAAYKMPLGAYLSRFARLMGGRLAWGDALRSDYIQRRMLEMPPVVRDAVMGLAAGTPNRAKYLATKAARGIAGADGLFTAGTYAILYDYHLTQARKAGIPNPENHAHAEAERLTDQVAQPMRTGARSWLEISMQNQPAFRALWNFSTDPRQKISLIVYEALRHDVSGKDKAAAVGKAVAVTWAVSGILQAVLRSVFRDLRNDDDDELFDERHWDLKRLGLMASVGPIGGIPYLGGMIESSIYNAAGEWKPANGLLDALSSSVPAVKRLATLDSDDVLKDIESVLSGGAVLSGTSAAGASAMHAVRDAVNIYENFDGKD